MTMLSEESRKDLPRESKGIRTSSPTGKARPIIGLLMDLSIAPDECGVKRAWLFSGRDGRDGQWKLKAVS
jgi:hypothetical protein